MQLSLQSLQQNPLPTNVARKILNYVVSSAEEQPLSKIDLQNNISVNIPTMTPWFERWRETFLAVQYPSDHEFTRHFVACMIVVSSDEANILTSIENTLKILLQLQNQVAPQRFPKFFSSNILRYYVILHDKVNGSAPNSTAAFDKIKNVYGSDRCFLLNINSRNSETTEPPLASNPWLPYISLSQYSTTVASDADSDAIQTPGDISIGAMSPSGFQTDPADNSAIIASEHFRPDVELETSTSTISGTSVHLHPLSITSDDHSSFQDTLDDSSSRTSPTSVVYGAHLTTEDLQQIHRLIQDFWIKALIPHVESEIHRLTDIVANRKGVSRSLFNATKRWFVTNKPGNSGPATPSKM